MKDCLESHREDSGFSAECKDELEAMMEKRAADFRLDSTLREVLLLVLGPGLFISHREHFPQMCRSFRHRHNGFISISVSSHRFILGQMRPEWAALSLDQHTCERRESCSSC